ncbi:MAG: GvpL/GvpF family gas vesicle protein [Planctomycetota bacterium]|nr:GvpL/GvpF family gas vesicle protein [Planctomycetota bacterium]
MATRKPGTNGTGLYLYGVLAGSAERQYGSCGINGQTVYTISSGPVSAVVSEFSEQKISPQRSHLAAHHEVLRKVMEESTVLPMRFGVIAENTKALRKTLARNIEDLEAEVRRLEGKAEMGLRVAWDLPNIFEHMVNSHPELRMARNRIVGGYTQVTQQEKIELGSLFDRILNEDRERHAERVEAVLSPHCFEIKSNPCRNEKEVINLACLVGRDALAQFENAVIEAAKLFDNNFAFDYNGPWAPHNFVQMELNLLR